MTALHGRYPETTRLKGAAAGVTRAEGEGHTEIASQATRRKEGKGGRWEDGA